MKLNKPVFCVIFNLAFVIAFFSQQPVKILFDAKKAQTAGNADWVIDADQWNLLWNPNATLASSGNQSNAQRFPTPSQTLITASTPETFWTGAISYWGIDCVKKGYQVETLPYSAQITYGNSSNPQDLSNYKVYIVCEPNILFSTSEKTAIMQFVQNGGGLFLISDHTVSDRNFDGNDSPVIWNDFITNNGVLNSALGFTFDLANFSQTSSNIPNLPTDSILHGPMGNVTQVKWSGGTTLALDPIQNPTVKGVVYKTGSSFGNSNVLFAYARVGNGKVAAIGDSSPPDDGSGDPNDVLYDGYITDAAGNHQRLLMNATIWLARGGSSITGIPENSIAPISVYPNPVSDQLNFSFENNSSRTIQLTDLSGRMIRSVNVSDKTTSIDLKDLKAGIYFLKLLSENKLILSQKIIKLDN
ncbi:MAG: T9SS type A sorting domain-containing protein [Bacteroidetes bacterium]|nr:T9SS type A sorting domain-containing protein [Bacteroidota bacterium]